jgi:hypothetical protein
MQSALSSSSVIACPAYVEAIHRLDYPGRPPLVLPVHRGRIKAGIILDALKKAGISPQEFQERL